MALWTFRDYVTEEGQNLIQQWYAAQDDAVRAVFDATVLILGETEDWLNPEIEAFKELTKKHAGLGLGELRFSVDVRPPRAAKAKRRRFRPIGIFRPARREFIFILACEKFRMNTIPPKAFDEAARYKSEFNQTRGDIHEHV